MSRSPALCVLIIEIKGNATTVMVTRSRYRGTTIGYVVSTIGYVFQLT